MKREARAVLAAARQLVKALEAYAPARPRTRWTPEMDSQLRRLYPDTPMPEILNALGVKRGYSIHGRASRLGVTRSKQFKALNGRFDGKIGERFRFKPGHASWNKGRKLGPAKGRSALTTFKKGRTPHNWQPIGSEKYSKEGYLLRKVTDHRNPARKDWRPVHHLIWESHRGPIPKGFAVTFKNGDKRDVRFENLALISRRANMQRNSIHNVPAPVKSLIYAQISLKRTITQRSKKNGSEQN